MSATSEITRVELRFHDSSVPPPYHRSYTLAVSASEVRKVTDSYGDVVSDQKRPGTPADLAQAVAAYEAASLSLGAEKDTAGCTGGTGLSVAIYAGGTEVFTGYTGLCAGEWSGPLQGDVEGLLASLLRIAALPDAEP